MCDRNYGRGSSGGGQLYGRVRTGRGRGPAADDIPSSSVRRGAARTVSQSQAQQQQAPRLASSQAAAADQNLSDVGNEEWETASESSDVLAHHHTQDAVSAAATRHKFQRGDNVSEVRTSQRSNSSGNGRTNHQRGGSRDQTASSRSSVTPDTAANRFTFIPRAWFACF